jgi:hypothetical protein
MRLRHLGKMFDVALVDDATLDTVIMVDGQVVRFDREHAAEFRREDGSLRTAGLAALAREAIDADLFEDVEDGGEG